MGRADRLCRRRRDLPVAIALQALRISDHASALAYVEAARVAPTVLLLLVAGALVDRLPRRLVVLGSNALRAGAIAALAALVAVHALTLTELVLFSALVGTADAFFYPAYRGTSAAFALDAATFVASALCLLAMARMPAPAPSGRSVIADARQGLRWTVRQRWLWYSMLGAGVANFAAFAPTAVTLPLIVRDALHQGPVAYGATFGAVGVGGLLAAVVAGRLGSSRRRMTMIWTAWSGASIALVGVGLAPDVVVVAACGAITYFGLTYGNLLWRAVRLDRRARRCWSAPGCRPWPARSSSCQGSETRSGPTTRPCRCPRRSWTRFAVMDARTERYAADVGAALAEVLGPDLIGAYLHGSAVLGGFDARRSDVDVLAVSRAGMSAAQQAAAAAALSEERLPGPARGLELSVVTLAAAKYPVARAAFELHLTTGPQDGKVVDGHGHGGDPDLVLHFAVCRAAGRLLGPGRPADQVLAPVPAGLVRAQLAAELSWASEQRPGEYAVLNACRAWRFAADGVLVSKVDGGEWALGRVARPDQELVVTALARQRCQPAGEMDAASTRRFVGQVLTILHR